MSERRDEANRGKRQDIVAMNALDRMREMWKQVEVFLLSNNDGKGKHCELSAQEGDSTRESCKSNHEPVKSRLFNYSIAVVFLSFAIMQLNDPDPLRWMLMYGLVALVSMFAGQGRHCRDDVLLGGLVACVFWTLFLLPEFISWVQIGMPTITGSMQAEEPHIEYTREFFGLLLCGAVLGTHLLRSKKGKAGGSGDKHSSVKYDDLRILNA